MRDVIIEAYEDFIRENQDNLNTPHDLVRVITDDGFFRAYKDTLTEKLDIEVRPSVMKIMDAQRNMLLTESTNVGASQFANGWVLMSLIESDF
jgi:hypothetical protein